MRFLLVILTPSILLGQTDVKTVSVLPKYDLSARTKAYTKRTFTSPARYIWLVGENAFNRYGTHDKTWGKNPEDFPTSIAGTFGHRVVSNTTEFLFSYAIRDDVRYRKSDNPAFVPRIIHSVGQAFIAHDSRGHAHPPYSKIIGTSVGAYVANQWIPDPRNPGNVAEQVAFSFVDAMQSNILDEFGPDLKRFGSKVWGKIRHNHSPKGVP